MMSSEQPDINKLLVRITRVIASCEKEEQLENGFKWGMDVIQRRARGWLQSSAQAVIEGIYRSKKREILGERA